jgi:hypothetical protein
MSLGLQPIGVSPVGVISEGVTGASTTTIVTSTGHATLTGRQPTLSQTAQQSLLPRLPVSYNRPFFWGKE